jgi:hypothetical protein
MLPSSFRRLKSVVDPSMSVKRKVTVPVGRGAMWFGLLEARMGPLAISDVRRGLLAFLEN